MIKFLKKGKLLSYLFIICIMIFIILILIILKQRSLVVDSRKESLQMLVDEKALHISTFLESQKEKLEILSSMNVFKKVVVNPSDPANIIEAKKRIVELKNYFPGIGVLTKEGIVIVAENNLAGTDYSALPQFPADDKSTITFLRYYDNTRKKDFFAIGGPIYDGVEKTKLIGIITFDIELDEIGGLMKEAFDKGGSDEVYLIGEDGLLLSSSEYIGTGNKSGVLIQNVKSEGAEECLEDLGKYKIEGIDGESGEVEEHEEEVIRYVNYMGNNVFGAHAYVTTIMGCVIAEESATEILSFSMVDYIENVFNKY